jgi:PAS domain S-box-containing protein
MVFVVRQEISVADDMTGADWRFSTTREVAQHDRARIEAEFARFTHGNDPFAEAVRATRMPMIITNPRLRDNPVVFANESFCRLSGYPRDEIVGRNCRFLQGPETDPATVARIRAAVQAAEPLEIDIRNHRRGGEPFWNRLLMAPVYDAGGELAYFFASQVDVTIERERLAGLENHNAALMAELAGRLHAQKASEARLRFAAQAGRMGIWELDLRTSELMASPDAKEIFGRDREASLSYEQKLQAIHPDDRARRDAAMQAAIEHGDTCDIEYRVVPAQGGVRWVQTRAQVVRTANGEAVRVAGVSMDTTARRDAEERLTLSEESLRLAAQSADIGTWDLDVEFGVLIYSERTRAMFGMRDEAPLTLDDFYNCLHEDDAPAVRAAFSASLDPNIRSSYESEYRVIGRDDGVLRWIAARGRAIFDTNGRAQRALGIVTDISRRKAADLRQEFLLALWDELRTLKSPKCIMDAAAGALGRHLGVNQAGYGQVQADGEQILLESSFTDGVPALTGMQEMERMCPKQLARLQAGMTVVCPDMAGEAPDASGWAAAHTGASISVPLVRDSRLTALLYISTAIGRSWNHDEVALVEDVAARTWNAVERAWAETALREANDALEGRIATALAERETIEEALRQAQKMEAVGQLTGGIAHDFNNLLAGIMGSLEFLQKRLAAGRTDGLERYTTSAMTSAQRATALTQRLLAFARRQPLDPKRVDSNRLVAAMEDLLRRTLGPGIQLEMVLAGGLWPTLCDPNQLDSAILNLAINARDAMGEGGRLTIETSNAYLDDAYARRFGGEVRAGQYIAVSVTDTGTGMPPEVIAKAFDPFFTTKPTGQGTGLGLSMVYGFVKQSEGHVSIYSEMGQGTTFRLYLPRYRGDVTEDHEGGTEMTGSLQAEAGETVLVVDDEPTVRMLVTETLEELGYTAVEAVDAQTGLAVLQSQQRVDLLITDVGLPGLNGRQLADAARVMRPDLKVLFMTGYAHNAAVGQGSALEHGMEIITKPFALEALAKKIREMIEE